MTVIAWDGKWIAADRQSTIQGMPIRTEKLHDLGDGRYMAGSGDTTRIAAMLEWVRGGCQKTELPPAQLTDDFATLIVAGPEGCIFYQRDIFPIYVLNPFMAWGSGSDIAMGAMAHGASAEEACEIACRFDVHCGLGVDAILLQQP